MIKHNRLIDRFLTLVFLFIETHTHTAPDTLYYLERRNDAFPEDGALFFFANLAVAIPLLVNAFFLPENDLLFIGGKDAMVPHSLGTDRCGLVDR